MVATVEASLVFLVAILAFAYAAYFLLMRTRSSRGYGVALDPDYRPSVSLIICAYNEEKSLADKIRNTLKLDYPRDKLEIIVFDNGSKDKTFDVASEFANEGIKVYKLNAENTGKAGGLNVAFGYASGDILAMTDVDCRLDEAALTKSMPYFADPKVGAVCGMMVVMNPEETSNARLEETLQDVYQSLQKMESTVDSTVVFHGDFTAFRKGLIDKVDQSLAADDTQIAVRTRNAGKRALFVEDAKYYVYSPTNFKTKWKQKIRRGSAIVQVLLRYRNLLFDKRLGFYGMAIFPWNFFMHAVSAYIFFSAIGLAVFVMACDPRWLTGIAILVLLGLLVGTSAGYYAKGKISYFVNVLMTFTLSQLVLLVGSLSLLKTGKTLHKWEPIDNTRR